MKKLNKPVRSIPIIRNQNIIPVNHSSIFSNPLSTSSIMNTVKLQLSTIKIDIQKLISQEQTLELSEPLSPQPFQQKLLILQQSYQKLKTDYDKHRQSQAFRSAKLLQLSQQNKQLSLVLSQTQTMCSNLQMQKLNIQTQYQIVLSYNKQLLKQKQITEQKYSSLSQQNIQLIKQNQQLTKIMEQNVSKQSIENKILKSTIKQQQQLLVNMEQESKRVKKQYQRKISELQKWINLLKQEKQVSQLQNKINTIPEPPPSISYIEQQLQITRIQLQQIVAQLQITKQENNKLSQKVRQQQLLKLQTMTQHGIEVELENKLKEIEMLKMKIDMLTKKVEDKNMEVRKKDDFIKNVIVNRVGIEGERLKKELEENRNGI